VTWKKATWLSTLFETVWCNQGQVILYLSIQYIWKRQQGSSFLPWFPHKIKIFLKSLLHLCLFYFVILIVVTSCIWVQINIHYLSLEIIIKINIVIEWCLLYAQYYTLQLEYVSYPQATGELVQFVSPDCLTSLVSLQFPQREKQSKDEAFRSWELWSSRQPSNGLQVYIFLSGLGRVEILKSVDKCTGKSSIYVDPICVISVLRHQTLDTNPQYTS